MSQIASVLHLTVAATVFIAVREGKACAQVKLPIHVCRLRIDVRGIRRSVMIITRKSHYPANKPFSVFLNASINSIQIKSGLYRIAGNFCMVQNFADRLGAAKIRTAKS